MCYWPGGGKEEQFPPRFGRQGGAGGTAINTHQGGFRRGFTANVAQTKDENDKQPFALMTTTSLTIKVVTSQVPSTITDPNSIPSCDKSTRQGCERERACVMETLDSTELLMEDQAWLDYLWDFETREINLDLSSDTD